MLYVKQPALEEMWQPTGSSGKGPASQGACTHGYIPSNGCSSIHSVVKALTSIKNNHSVSLSKDILHFNRCPFSSLCRHLKSHPAIDLSTHLPLPQEEFRAWNSGTDPISINEMDAN